MFVLRRGRVLDPSGGVDRIADVWFDKEILRIEPPGSSSREDQVPEFDAQGLWILPGLIDLHVHFREPGHEYKEDIESGLLAAAAGGFTAVCTMPNTSPVNDRRSICEAMVNRARECGGTELFPFGAITQGLSGAHLTEMGDLRDAGAIGVSDDGRCVGNSQVMRRALEYARNFDLIVSQHCEDHSLTQNAQIHEGVVSTKLGLRGWPREAEDLIVARDLLLAEQTGARYHVAHVSSMGAVRLLREAKSRGLRVSAEVTPHHLTLTHESVLGYNTACKVNPPLRTEEDRQALVAALADGTIDCVATDHAPHDSNEKNCEFDAAAFGISGVETAVSVVFELAQKGAFPLLRCIEALSSAPARILGDTSRGSLSPGKRADIMIFDPDIEWTPTKTGLRSKSHNTPWLNHSLRGKTRATIVGGKMIFGEYPSGP